MKALIRPVYCYPSGRTVTGKPTIEVNSREEAEQHCDLIKYHARVEIVRDGPWFYYDVPMNATEPSPVAEYSLMHLSITDEFGLLKLPLTTRDFKRVEVQELPTGEHLVEVQVHMESFTIDLIETMAGLGWRDKPF